MKNKMIAAVAVLALSASVAVAAPHGGKFGGKRGHRAEFGRHFADKLNLTDAQKEQIKAIRKETREQNAAFFQSFQQSMQQLRAARKANDTARLDALKSSLAPQREQMKQIRQAERQRVLSVLTAEQRTQFEQWEAKRGQRHQGKRNQQ